MAVEGHGKKKSCLYESNRGVQFFTRRMTEPEWRCIGISPCWPKIFILDQEYNYIRLRVEVDPVRDEDRHRRQKSYLRRIRMHTLQFFYTHVF